MSGDSKILINLESLLSLGAKLNETNDEILILNITLLSLMGKLKLFRGIVFVPDKSKEYFIPVVSKGKQNIEKIPAFEIKEICKISGTDELSVKENISELHEAGYEICIPIIYRSELMALICLSKKLDSTEITDEEYYYISLVSSITANSLNNTKNINLLLNEKNMVESRNQLLTTLFEVSRDFNVFLSEEKIIKTLSLNLLGQLMITRFAVIYQEEGRRGEGKDRITEKQKDGKNILRQTQDDGEKRDFNILKNTFKEKLPLEQLNEFLSCKDTCFTDELSVSDELQKWIDRNEVWVVSPMMMKSSIKGFLLIGRSTVGRLFTEENLLFIKVIGNTTVLALENLKLIQKEVERQKLESEFALALEIQKKLLPKECPKTENFDIFGTTIPSKFVGGDYYDFIRLPNGNLMIAIADVSGKGMPAALLMANVQAALRVLSPLGLPLNQLLFRLNNLVFQNTSADRFVTFFCGELNPKENTFEYINAGHNPPILIKSNKEIELLNLGGIILGVLENVDNYKTGKIVLQSGDLVLFYTDGVTEAKNAEDDEYGENRLLKIMESNKLKISEELVNDIVSDVRNYVKSEVQFDDITVIAINVQT